MVGEFQKRWPKSSFKLISPSIFDNFKDPNSTPERSPLIKHQKKDNETINEFNIFSKICEFIGCYPQEE